MHIVDDTKKKMQATLEHFKQELKGLRTSRANPSMLDHVMVEVYGSPMRLRDLANITTPEARQILIVPFDPSVTSAIGKGIEKANLNLQPIVGAESVRINIPPMDEATRKEIVKQAKKQAEDAKVKVREVRRKNNETARKMKADGELTEDLLKKAEKGIQELTDQFCKEVDEVLAVKEKEILTV